MLTTTYLDKKTGKPYTKCFVAIVEIAPTNDHCFLIPCTLDKDLTTPMYIVNELVSAKDVKWVGKDNVREIKLPAREFHTKYTVNHLPDGNFRNMLVER